MSKTKKVGMSCQQFIESQGATCNNWRYSWSFIKESEKLVIFGAWDRYTKDNKTWIFSEDWRTNNNGRKLPGFEQSKKHIELIEDEGYHLMTFPAKYSDANKDKKGIGPAKRGAFTPILNERTLSRDREGRNWYASGGEQSFAIPKKLSSSDTYPEGAPSIITVNSYERNSDARNKYIEHHGYSCAVCGFSFEAMYGSLGKDYIHVHHIVPIHTRQEKYEVDPIKDLIPVCPNCHAMIHKDKPSLTVNELKEHIAKRKSVV